MFDAHTYDFSAEEYDKAYNAIYTTLTMPDNIQTDRRAYILGGQPGAGESTFYAGNGSLDGYIVIDGDQCRRYHPRYDDIVRYDLDNYATRTQQFVNQVIEQLIDDLSTNEYNIIIEGTLRNPEVPIKTCNLLKEKGYDPKFVVVACDAEQSWKSTIFRAKLMHEMGEKPRLVPIDKYNAIVNGLPNSLDVIADRQCFDSINIINRDNEVLYRLGDEKNPSDIIRDTINIDRWNENFNRHVQEYLGEKINLIKKESEKLYEQGYFSRAHEEVSARDR